MLDKYEIDLNAANFHLLASSWIHALRSSAKGELNVPQLLYVAHKLGDFMTLKQTVHKQAQCSNIAEDGSLSSEDGRRISDIAPINKELLVAIETVRNRDIEAFLQKLKDPYDYFMDPEVPNGRKYCKSTQGHVKCNQKLFWSLLNNLIQQRLFPFPEPQTYKGSFDDLVQKTLHMSIRGLVYPGVEQSQQRHMNCSLGHLEAVMSIRRDDEDIPLADHLVEHMYFMGKRCGMFRTEMEHFEPYKETLRGANILCRDDFSKGMWGWLDPDGSEAEGDADDSYYVEDLAFFGSVDENNCVRTEQWAEREVGLKDGLIKGQVIAD